MTDDERGLLLTVARILRARIGDPGGTHYDDEDIQAIKDALKPFDPSDAPPVNLAGPAPIQAQPATPESDADPNNPNSRIKIVK